MQIDNKRAHKNLEKIITANFITVHNKHFYEPRHVTQLIAVHSMANQNRYRGQFFCREQYRCGQRYVQT